MTIRHFYILAGYALWTYALLCMLGKTLADRYHRYWQEQQKKRLTAFLSPELPQSARRGKLKHLLKLCREDALLAHLCRCYRENRSRYDPVSAPALGYTVRLILEDRVSRAPQDTALSRCLIVRSIRLCGMDSPVIRSFLAACGTGSPLEQRWAAKCSPDGRKAGSL